MPCQRGKKLHKSVFCLSDTCSLFWLFLDKNSTGWVKKSSHLSMLGKNLNVTFISSSGIILAHWRMGGHGI